MVGERGLEPPRAEAHSPLKAARLPVPPLAHTMPPFCKERSPGAIGSVAKETDAAKAMPPRQDALRLHKENTETGAWWAREESNLHGFAPTSS
jgi:hypothetical protein